MVEIVAPPGIDDLRAAAQAATRDGPADEALRLWSEHRRLRPGSPVGYATACRILRGEGRFEEAEALCEQGLRQCAGTPVLLRVEWARIAHQRGELALALRRWATALDAAPDHAPSLAGVARCLMDLGRLDDAARALEAAQGRHDSDDQVARVSAQLAAAREDWAGAIRQWEAILARAPNDGGAARALSVARHRATLAEAGEDDGAQVADVGRTHDPELRALVLGFESLGRDCEFGLVQRRFGAEPLGLLRWANTRAATLATWLETSFAGLAEPANLTVERKPGEDVIRDREFGQVFHTFQVSDPAEAETFLARHSTRLRWLRDKLVDDLREGEKILVYKPTFEGDDAAFARVARGVRAAGPNTLLWVSLAPDGTEPGSVTQGGPGVLRGYLSRINPVRKGVWDIPFDEWAALCRRARALVPASS